MGGCDVTDKMADQGIQLPCYECIRAMTSWNQFGKEPRPRCEMLSEKTCKRCAERDIDCSEATPPLYWYGVRLTKLLENNADFHSIDTLQRDITRYIKTPKNDHTGFPAQNIQRQETAAMTTARKNHIAETQERGVVAKESAAASIGKLADGQGQFIEVMTRLAVAVEEQTGAMRAMASSMEKRERARVTKRTLDDDEWTDCGRYIKPKKKTDG